MDNYTVNYRKLMCRVKVEVPDQRFDRIPIALEDTFPEPCYCRTFQLEPGLCFEFAGRFPIGTVRVFAYE